MAPLRASALRCSSAAFGDEAEFLGDFRPGRRKAVVFQAALDEGEDLGLAGRQLLHVVALCFYPVTGIIYSERGVAMIFRMTFRPASR